MATRKRKALSSSIRFEVFKRDSFKCKWCGRAAPDVVLHVDHIHPHSKGGSDEIINLATSCQQCNSGKGARTIDDTSVVAKQRAQLEDLNERREQIEMMLRWRNGLVDLKEQELEAFISVVEKRTGYTVTDHGKAGGRRAIKKFGLPRVLDAVDRAADYALRFGQDGKLTQDSVNHFFNCIWVFSEPEDVQSLYQIKKRVCNRWNYSDHKVALGLLKRVLNLGVPVAEIDAECQRIIKERNTSFSFWRGCMEDWVTVLLEKAVAQ